MRESNDHLKEDVAPDSLDVVTDSFEKTRANGKANSPKNVVSHQEDVPDGGRHALLDDNVTTTQACRNREESS